MKRFTFSGFTADRAVALFLGLLMLEGFCLSVYGLIALDGFGMKFATAHTLILSVAGAYIFIFKLAFPAAEKEASHG